MKSLALFILGAGAFVITCILIGSEVREWEDEEDDIFHQYMR